MNETYMNYISGESFFTYGSTDPAKIKRLKRRIEQQPDGVEVIMDDPDFGFMVHLPVGAWNYETKPKRKGREMSDEERQELAARLMSARKASSGA